MSDEQKDTQPSTTGIVENHNAETASVSRRGFLKGLGGTGAMAAVSSLGLGASLLAPGVAQAKEVGPLTQVQRRNRAFQLRRNAAHRYVGGPITQQPCNGDEALYADKRASYSKGLVSNNLGEVSASSYQSLITAVTTGNPADYEAIQLHSATPFQKQTSPQGGLAFEMFGIDGHAGRIPPFPTFAGNELAAHIGEVYWQAITRDVPYNHYGTDPLVAAAVDDLDDNFSFKIGPTSGGHITTDTVFRGEWDGDLTGPYVSQFLWLPIPYGPQLITQQFPTPVPGVDYGTTYASWLSIQRDEAPPAGLTFEGDRYVYSARGLGEWVHRDFSFQAPLNAALILFFRYGVPALADTNPYKTSATQNGFITFFLPGIAHIVALAGDAALKAAWFQKWHVHRPLRPEALAGRVENQTNGAKNYGLHPDIINSDAVAHLQGANGTALLPLAFPEGSPTHPTYTSGHATFVSAGVTVCKAFFKEDFVIPDPVVSNDDGTALDPWTGDDLTVLGELNKIVSNVAIGRNAAGVHYRADAKQGNLLGEQVGISILCDYSTTYNEDFSGFELTKYDGQKIRIFQGTVTNI